VVRHGYMSDKLFMLVLDKPVDHTNWWTDSNNQPARWPSGMYTIWLWANLPINRPSASNTGSL
jgi:hypothetical protein